MGRSLLLVPHFWDPICVPLAASSLRAYAGRAGHDVALFDFNTVPEVFAIQQLYFEEVKRQLPEWCRWNIERNGTDILAMHQMVYLHARARRDYRELIAEIFNVEGKPLESIAARIDIAKFDALFGLLFNRVAAILERLLETIQPEVIGCTLLNSTWPATLFLLRRAKALRPTARIVVGGAGPVMGLTTDKSQMEAFRAANDFIDYYVVGEGERAFLRILNEPDLAPGVIGQSPPNAIAMQKSSALEMDALPDPDYGDLDPTRYLQLSVASSRGCPYACSFCAETIFWEGFRRREAAATAYQMLRLADRYGNKSFYLCDSLANPVIEGISTTLLESGQQLRFDAYLRADKSCVDPKRTAKWHDAGLFRARLGMESGNQRILNAMVKMTTTETMSRALLALAEGGVRTSTLWIVGYPSETAIEFEDTLTFIREHRDHIYEADAWLFQYHSTGLAGSGKFESESGSQRRFSDELTAILGIDFRVINDGISSGERFDRLARFVSEMETNGIPNPYSMSAWRNADERWSRLGHRSRHGVGTT